MGTLRLAVSRPYDRVHLLTDRPHSVGGFELETEVVKGAEVQEIFRRLSTSDEFELGEMSLSFFVSLISEAGEDCPIIGLPIFMSRTFRYGNIYVRSGEAGDPQTLDGRRIGMFEYAMTMGVWLRGILREDHGIDLAKTATWVTTRQPAVLDHDFVTGDRRIEFAGAGRPLHELLLAGEIDAYFGSAPRTPTGELVPGVTRLCPDYHERDVAYFRRTGCFPIMHLIAMRRSTYQALGGDVVREICALFARAKADAIAGHLVEGSLDVTMPFMIPAWERQVEVLGDDPWPYGFEKNRHVIETFIGYMEHDRLLHRPVVVEDLFVPETLDQDL